MQWKDILNNWKNNKPLKYPKNINTPFLWRTSVINNMESNFIQEFTECKYLDVQQDYTAYESYIKKTKNKYVTSFPNLSGDAILVIPIPKNNKNFSNLKNFSDNASKTQQQKLWNKVASIIKKELKKKNKIWVSTHGLGVPYLHIRISTSPKYYGNSKLKN